MVVWKRALVNDNNEGNIDGDGVSDSDLHHENKESEKSALQTECRLVSPCGINIGQEMALKKDFFQDDKISELPDCIIHIIFPFLSIEDVLRIYALSKRWKSLLISIFDIVFDETKYQLRSDLKTNFFHSLETILFPHSAPCIRKFSLIFKDKNIGLSRLNSWVSVVVSLKVQELDLSLPISPLLPDNLFTYESLSILKLNFSFNVPTFIQVPKLKTLHLRVLGDLSAQLLEQLFSSCPALQELALNIDNWNNRKKITISIRTLRTLVVCPYIDEEISKQRAKEIMARHAIKLMRGIHHVKFLTLSNDILES
ncbi:F-box/LRR-repeat protein At3g59200-like [Pistacia vera]|uniref:F-box/LRR-repeat protein At3g59200-like n=1 Tax=Pistacia vera TaxID=55513 RepID=UPI001262F4B4|nr:F-box/LRR-repeat protein At3g59200-like [Pistacia vera]